MKTIHEFTLHATGRQDVAMPIGAKVLCAMNGVGVIRLCAEVNDADPKVLRTFVVVGTGNPMPRGKLAYVGSVIQGPFAWHVYEELS